MSKRAIPLFHFDLFRVSPDVYDAACRAYEVELRERGAVAHLDRLAAEDALIKASKAVYPWKAQRCGWVHVELNEDTFTATLYLTADRGRHILHQAPPAHLHATFELGKLADDPAALRTAFESVAEWAAGQVEATVYVDSAYYEMLVERFDIKRFRADFAYIDVPAANKLRNRLWN